MKVRLDEDSHLDLYLAGLNTTGGYVVELPFLIVERYRKALIELEEARAPLIRAHHDAQHLAAFGCSVSGCGDYSQDHWRAGKRPIPPPAPK